VGGARVSEKEKRREGDPQMLARRSAPALSPPPLLRAAAAPPASPATSHSIALHRAMTGAPGCGAPRTTWSSTPCAR
jgi:hypothetical protein